MPSANFDKVCKRCSKEKHISEFRRNKKINVICNECMQSEGTKTCPYCHKSMFINAFVRFSMKCGICNRCYEKSVEKSADMFKIGFEIMNKFEKRIEKCIRQ